MSPWRTVLVIPDTHVPDHHVKAWRNVVALAEALQPDQIIHVGDFLDCKGPARWSKGLAEEFQGALQDEADEGYNLLLDLRQRVPEAQFDYLEGNHEARIRNYLKLYAPALSGIRGTRLEDLLGFKDLEITLRRQPFVVSKNFVAIHGDKLSSVGGGMSAHKMVRELGLSVVQGHSHRGGLVYESRGEHRFGMEVGHLSDIKKASYLGVSGANWQMGCGVLRIKDNWVQPEFIRIMDNGSFGFEGVTFG